MELMVDVDSQYAKDKNMNKDDIKALMDWVNKQPHLPNINELQAILFYHSCYYRNEAAKAAIDSFFTAKTAIDMFKNRDPSSPATQAAISVAICVDLPKKTPEGYTIYFLRLKDRNASNFNLENIYRLFDLASMLERYKNGISNGHLILMDFTGWTFGHTARLNPLALKNYLYYLQEALPIRLKGLHFYKAGAFIDGILSLAKPFLKKETTEKIQIHNALESLTKFIPLECLPEEYGGSIENAFVFYEKMKNDLLKNKALFKWEETLTVDEKKRPGGKSHLIDIYGTDGTFKKLAVD